MPPEAVTVAVVAWMLLRDRDGDASDRTAPAWGRGGARCPPAPPPEVDSYFSCARVQKFFDQQIPRLPCGTALLAHRLPATTVGRDGRRGSRFDDQILYGYVQDGSDVPKPLVSNALPSPSIPIIMFRLRPASSARASCERSLDSLSSRIRAPTWLRLRAHRRDCSSGDWDGRVGIHLCERHLS